MQVHMHDVYEKTGKVNQNMAKHIVGHKHHVALLPNLFLLNQHIKSRSDLSIIEEADAGLYFSFIGGQAIQSIDDIDSVQISYLPRKLQGELEFTKGEQVGLLQMKISSAHLATTLGENEDQIIQHFRMMKEKLGNDNGIIELPFTEKLASLCEPVLTHTGHSISLAGHIYAVIFNLIEQLQMLSHLSQCEDCQSKLFNAQNRIEMLNYEVLDIKQLSQQVGLNPEALEIGFNLIVGQPIRSYWTLTRVKSAAVRLRENPTNKGSILAQSGLSEEQFEAAFLQHFGVSSHHYGQIH
ncbi:AraC family transcriptional regulator [Marinomonas sp. C2222]|uniref:AraC family transcriptional regulator n=1 Tax=Marinomonas sargassi TaxID=2984494 RepID=A0ABT2YR48_9GAMM|nr:AraC family transcriptional regulator [Marinomonas sargassi]MCV2402369.1 AraC family transcriptional regulator [Marinomonas sargassi]